MSFLYPNIISIARTVAASGIGAQGYDDLTQETVLATGIPANVQLSSSLRQVMAGLPGDVARGTMWDIFFKDTGLAVRDRDIITDETGNRYQVMGTFKHPLGYSCSCERLQS